MRSGPDGAPALPPEVSIVLPAHRDGATLGDALADVRAQTGCRWECLLLLDGADAATARVAHAVAAEDTRIRLIERPHRGLVATLNEGVALARSPIVVRFDADDRMHPERAARLLAALSADPALTVVTSHVAWESLSPETDGRGMARHCAWLNGLHGHDDLMAMRFVDAPLAHPAVAYLREHVLPFGPYRDGDFAEDHDLWLRLFAAGHRFAVIPEPLVTWRDRPSRLTRSDTRYRDDRRKRLVHDHLVAGPLAAPGRPIRVWGAGAYGRRHVRGLRTAAAARGVDLNFKDFIDIDPKKVGRRLQGDLPVIHADDLGPPDGALLLVAVAAAGARALIEAELASRGWARERDYLLLQ